MINSPVLCALQTEQRQILVPLRRQSQAHKLLAGRGAGIWHAGNMNTRQQSSWGWAAHHVKKRTLLDGQTNHTRKRGSAAQEKSPRVHGAAERAHVGQPGRPTFDSQLGHS